MFQSMNKIIICYLLALLVSVTTLQVTWLILFGRFSLFLSYTSSSTPIFTLLIAAFVSTLSLIPIVYFLWIKKVKSAIFLGCSVSCIASIPIAYVLFKMIVAG